MAKVMFILLQVLWLGQLDVKIKGKFVPVHTMKAYRGSGCIAPVIPISFVLENTLHFAP
jgi:hypothetical protein